MKRGCTAPARLAILIICGISVSSIVHSAEALAQPPSGKPPNIVFIFSDDHAYQAISAYNDPRRLIDTPHIDRLAREGMRFDRCVVPNSICGPSRASVLTGKYSHLNGFYNNTNSRFDGSQTTFPKLLRAAGYQTAVIGKWHLVTDPTGFDEWHILPGQGVYYNPTDDPQRPARATPGLHHRHHHRAFPRLAEEPRQVEAVLAHVPAQGAPPRVAAGDPPPGPRPRSPLSRAADAVSTITPGAARPSTTRT